MGAKKQSSRNIKKEVLRLFDRSFDMRILDYKKRCKPLKPKSMLIGIGVASALYLTGFIFAYMAMGKDVLPIEGFAKLVWIMMIPTTIIGILAWQIAKNRMEYPLRQEILSHMTELEKNGGLLWKFSPLMDIIGIEDTDTKKALAKSREGKTEELAVEDYTEAVTTLNDVLTNSDARQFSTVIAEAILENFAKMESK